MRGQTRSLGEALLGLLLFHEGVRTGNGVVGRAVGQSWFLKWGEVGARFVGWAEGWLRCSAHPLGGAVCRDPAQDAAAFVPSASEVGFWPFCILLFMILPQLCMYAVVFSPL